MTIEVLRDMFKKSEEVTLNKKQFEKLNSHFKALELSSELSAQLLAREARINDALRIQASCFEHAVKELTLNIS